MHYEPVAGRAVWYGGELARRDDWIRHFSAGELAEISEAVDRFRRSARPAESLSREAFALPRLGAVLREILDELLDGRGFILLRGLPVERMTREEQRDRLSRHRVVARQLPFAECKRPSPRAREGSGPRHPRSERALLPDQPQAGVPHRFGGHRGPAVPEDGEGGRRELPRELDDRVQRGARAPARAHACALRAVRRPTGAARSPKACSRGSTSRSSTGTRAASPASTCASTSSRRRGTSPKRGGLRTSSARRWI